MKEEEQHSFEKAHTNELYMRRMWVEKGPLSFEKT